RPRSSVTSTCSARSTPRRRRTATSAARSPTSRGRPPTAPTRCARPPASELCPPRILTGGHGRVPGPPFRVLGSVFVRAQTVVAGDPYGAGAPSPGRCPMGEPTVFPYDDPAFVADPFPLYKALRDEGPVRRVVVARGVEVWLITRYEDVLAALSDARF